MRALWMQVARTGTVRVYCLAASLAGTFITARYLGPEGRGVVAAALGWVSLFAMFAALSISPVILFVAAGRAEHEWLSKTFAGVTVILAVATVAGWIVAVLCAAAPNMVLFKNISRPVLVLVFALMPLMMWNESASSLFVAIGALDKLNLWQAFGATLTLGALVVFVAWADGGVTGALLATAIYQVTLAVVTLSVVARRARGFELDTGVIRTLLDGGLRLHLSAIATFAILQANVLFVNAFRSAAETGYYHLASQLILAIQMFSLSVGMVAQTVVAREGPDKAWPRQKQLLLRSSAVAIAITVGGLLLAPLVVRIVGGEKFIAAVPILRILLLGLLGMNVSLVMSSQWVGRGMFLRLTAISTVFGLASVVANYLLIPRFGAIGSAWVTTAVYMSSIFIHGAMAVWVNARAGAEAASAQAVG